MRIPLPLPVLLFVSNAVLAQVGPVQKEINAQVWMPFKAGYESLDPEAFMAVHTNDVIRIVRDADQIFAGTNYRRHMEENTAASRSRQVKRTIDLRFTERFAKGDYAYEAGYYKVVSDYGDNQEYTFYGQFDVILRRENGHWKIMVDSDTSKDGSLQEDDFLKGEPME